jgi:TolB-like protein
MASLIEGYEYDIFISYRQKDNKHDGWVTEFVNNLLGELESTFKEEISVYFDINPHDGLLETHDVDESLKEKLNCLIFIPIISRTYCDQKSFAWEHEFKAFVDEASNDQYGLKVRLPKGNVASRVLPVQIHDLDSEDIKQCETVLGSVLRGIEFIYKEAGVDKPLTQDDDEKKNLNNTKYRIQIVKVAHAIKEIISAIKQPKKPTEETTEKPVIEKPSKPPILNKKIIAASVIALLLLVAGLIFVPKLFKSSANLEKSIAVLPFIDDSPEKNNETTSFANGLMEDLLIDLQMIKEFRVPGRTSVEQYRDVFDKSLSEKARELNVNYIVEGSVQKIGDGFYLRVQLILAKGKEDHLWANRYEQEIKGPEELIKIQKEIAENIAAELKTFISHEEKLLIERIPTENLDAYYAYLRGNEEYSKGARAFVLDNNSPNSDALNRAEDLYRQALEYDPEYAQAYVGLAKVYWHKHYGEEYLSENRLDSVVILADMALSYDNNLAEAYSLRGDYYTEKADYDKAIREYEKTLEINPNYWQAYSGLADLYESLLDPINCLENITNALKLNHDPKERRPLLSRMALRYGSWFGFYDKSIEYYKEALKLDDDSMRYYGSVANIALWNEKYSETLQLYKRMQELNPGNNNLNQSIGNIFYILGQKETSVEWYKKYISGLDTLEPSTNVSQQHRVGFAYLVAGHKEKTEEYFELQKKYCEESINLNTIYGQWGNAYYDLACVFAIRGDKQNAYKNLHLYNDKIGDSGVFMIIWHLKTDPFLESIRNEPEFQDIYHEIEAKYNNTHDKVRKWLEEQGML